MTGNDKLRKVNQALRNEIEELKKKLQKVSDDQLKNQHGRYAERENCHQLMRSLNFCVLFIFQLQSARLSNSLRFLFLLDNCVFHVLVLPRRDQLSSYLRGKLSNFLYFFVQRIIKVVVVQEATSLFQKKLFPKGEDKAGLLPAEASLHREVNVKTITGNATARTK